MDKKNSIKSLADFLENPPKKLPNPHVGKYADYLRKGKIQDVESSVDSMGQLLNEHHSSNDFTTKAPASKKAQAIKKIIEQAEVLSAQEAAQKREAEYIAQQEKNELEIQDNIDWIKRMRSVGYPVNMELSPHPIHFKQSLKRLEGK